MAVQAKCWRCRIRWTWVGELPLDQTHCPQCGQTPLERTSYLVHLTPVHVAQSEVKR